MPINHSANYQDKYGRTHPVEWYSYGRALLPVAPARWPVLYAWGPGPASF